MGEMKIFYGIIKGRCFSELVQFSVLIKDLNDLTFSTHDGMNSERPRLVKFYRFAFMQISKEKIKNSETVIVTGDR